METSICWTDKSLAALDWRSSAEGESGRPLYHVIGRPINPAIVPSLDSGAFSRTISWRVLPDGLQGARPLKIPFLAESGKQQKAI